MKEICPNPEALSKYMEPSHGALTLLNSLPSPPPPLGFIPHLGWPPPPNTELNL